MTDGPGTATGQAALSGSFSVERDLPASPDRVFAAYAEPRLRRRWLRIPGSADAHYELDFRPGGGEVRRGRFAPNGIAGTEELIEYRSVFWDIVPGTRLVFGYELVLDGVRRWVSLVTVELPAWPGGEGTRLRHTEQYVLLAYADDGAREIAHLQGSTSLQLNGLAAALSGPQPTRRAAATRAATRRTPMPPAR
ncbi:MAG TPA: SRPBCC domain-containing protein [Trebonia sp.]